MVTIRRNEKLNGLEVAFEKKPSEAILTYLKDLRFRWSKPGKVWYKTYSESLEKQIREYFKDTPVKSSDTPSIASEEIHRIPMDEYFKSKRGPRKDIIISEVEAGKMEYAVKKSFDGMTDSWNYHAVTNESFRPAEEATRTYNNGNTVNFVIEDLKHAIGQSHYIYSARVEKNDELGYFIVFDDYYIRYKKKPAKQENIETNNIAFFYRRIPSKHSEIFEESISTIEEAIKKAKDSIGDFGSFSLLAYYDKANEKLFIEDSSTSSMINIVLYDFDTEYKLESIKWYKNHENLYAIAEKILKPKSIKPLGEKRSIKGGEETQPETKAKQSFGEIDSFEYKSGGNTIKYSLYNNRPIPDSITGEMEYFTIFNIVETSEKTYENYYGGFSSNNEAKLELEYLRKKYQLNEDVKKPIARNYGKTYEGLAESTAKSMMSQLDKSYKWELVSFKSKLGKFYLKGILKDIEDKPEADYKTTIDILKFKIGDAVQVTQEYFGAAKGSTGEVIEIKTVGGEHGAKIDFGSNLSGQKLQKVIPFAYLRKYVKVGEVYRDHKNWYYIYELEGSGISQSIKIYNFWSYGVDNDLGRFGMLQKHSSNMDWLDTYKSSSVDELKEFITSLRWYINNTYQDMYGGKEITEKQKQYLLEKSNDPIIMTVLSGINKNLEVKDTNFDETQYESAEQKAIDLITGSLVDRIKNNGYYFDYGQMNNETYYYLVAIISNENADKLKDAGITILGAKEMPGDDKPSPDPIAIAKAKAEALILILKLKNKNKEVPVPDIKAESLPSVKAAGVQFFEDYGVYPDSLAIRYNELVSDIKTRSITDAYTLMTDKEILHEDYQKFANDFINEIAKKGIKLKKPIELEEGIINIYRKPVKPINRKGIDSLKGIVVPFNEITKSPGLKGVFVDDGKLIAANPYQLVIISDDSHSEHNGKIIDINGEGFIEAKYPSYNSIIPSYNDKTSLIDIDILIESTNSVMASFKNIKDSYSIMIFDFDELDMGVNPVFLLEVLQILKINGAKMVNFEFSEPSTALLIRSDNSNLALVMPIEFSGRLLKSERVPIKFFERLTKYETPNIPVIENEPEPEDVSIPESITFEEFQKNRPKSVTVEYVGSRKPEFITYTYKHNRYSGRFGWYNRTMSKHISEKEAYDNYVFNLKNYQQSPSFADKVIQAAESVGATVKYENGGMIQSGPTLFDSLIDKKVIKLKEGGTIPVSQEWMGFYNNLKAANKRNIRTFADSVGITNEYNEPIIKYLLSKNVPLIVISHEELRKKIMFKLIPPPESAIFYAQYLKFKGHEKEIVNIYMSIMPKSMIGLGSWAISLGISLKEAIENTFVHECIHAYTMKAIGIDLNTTFNKKLDLLRSEMNDYIIAHPNDFSRIEKSANRIINDERSVAEELITYSFTMSKVANMLRKVPLKSGKTVWQELLSTVDEFDKNGILIIYVSKYGDVTPLSLAMAKAKYKIYLTKGEKIELGEGGRVKGPSHEEGGVSFIVRQTGQEVKLEGDEAVIKKKVVKSQKKYKFQGKEATPREILNKLNTDGGGNPI
jgi:hypothetical protein